MGDITDDGALDALFGRADACGPELDRPHAGELIAIYGEATCANLEALRLRAEQLDVSVEGWRSSLLSKLDSAAALDDAQKELAPVYYLMPLVLQECTKGDGDG